MRGLVFFRRKVRTTWLVVRCPIPPALLVMLVSCGDQPATQDFYVEPSIPENPIAQTQAAAAEVADREALPAASPILSLDGSGVTGELAITYTDGQIELRIQAEGLPSADEFAAHVHRGVCEEGGPVAAALSAVVGSGDGNGTSTTRLPSAALPITEPLFVQIHGSSGAPIACGDIVES